MRTTLVVPHTPETIMYCKLLRILPSTTFRRLLPGAYVDTVAMHQESRDGKQRSGLGRPPTIGRLGRMSYLRAHDYGGGRKKLSRVSAETFEVSLSSMHSLCLDLQQKADILTWENGKNSSHSLRGRERKCRRNRVIAASYRSSLGFSSL